MEKERKSTYPAAILGEVGHHGLGRRLLPLPHGDILKVAFLESDAFLPTQVLDPGSWVDASKQHEECGRLTRRLRVGARHVKGLLKHVFFAHHACDPVTQRRRGTIRPQRAQHNEAVKGRQRLLVVSWDLAALWRLAVEEFLPLVRLALHRVPKPSKALHAF